MGPINCAPNPTMAEKANFIQLEARISYFNEIEYLLGNSKLRQCSQGQSGLPCEFDADLW